MAIVSSLLLGEGCQALATNVDPGLVAGASSPAAAPARPAARDEGPRIELELLEPGRWRVTYHLARPAARLRFWRAAQWFRESTWTVKTPGYELGRDGNSQVLRTIEGATPTDTITVDIAEHTEVMQGEFRPMLAFSDGAIAIYTGHLYLRDVADEVEGEAPYLDTLAITAASDVTLAILGALIEGGSTTWSDPHDRGTYIYFSAPGAKLEPLVTEHMITVIDPGLPTAMADHVHELLPPMFELLASGYEATLPWRPMIIVAWEQGREDTRHWEGGVRPGLIYMTLGGEGWTLDDRGTMMDLAHFVGHEASHFWNGTLIHNRSSEDAWLHEGSAEAIADLLLHRLGLIDSATLGARHERAINHCLTGLQGTALSGAEQHRGRGVHYPCGYLMALWSDAALGSVDLFGIWAALIDEVGASNEYDRHDYFTLLRELGADVSLVATMENFVTNDSETQREDVIAGLARAGLVLAERDRPPVEERVRLAGEALVHLQRANCDRNSVSTFAAHLRTYPIEGCPSFSIEADIHGIAGQAVIDGDRAYDRVRTACAKRRSVKLAGPNGALVLQVACEQALPDRPAWLRFR